MAIDLRSFFGVVLVSCAAAAGYACDSGGSTTAGTGGSESTASNNPTNAGGSGGSTGAFTDPQIVSLEIDPPTATINIDNGVIPAATDFKVYGLSSDGGKAEVDAQWTFNRPDIAQVAGEGDVSATGLLGGVGTLQASIGPLVANAQVTVKLAYTNDPENVPQNIKDLFDGATTGDPTMALVYPYDKTVFPRGLLGPLIQWNGGNAADIYRVHIESPTFEYTGWGTVPPPSRYALPTMPNDIWRKLSDSSDGDVAIDVQRYDGTTAYLPVAQTWKIAPGNLAGTIYYWEVNQGNVVRLQPGASAPEQFIQKPAGVTCVACHSVSADGSTLVASFHGGYSPWGTFNTNDGTSIYATDTSSGFQAISPDGSHVIWGHWIDGGFNTDGALKLSTKDSNAVLATLSPGGAPGHPAWSKDGNKVAFSIRTNGNGLDFTQSTLWITDVTESPPAFSNTGIIVANDATRPTVTFPTFSPDSQWIAFERSTQARSRGAQSEIWLTNTDGTVQVELDNANGKTLLSDDQNSTSYEPTFNPVAAGGYFWLVIVTERQYGNVLTDTNVNSRMKQLWVTAIDTNPQPGVDPSHPAFWLPGQELNNQNMRGEWALSPCKQIGEDCSAGYECCDGYCIQDPVDMTFKCSDDSGGCSQLGDACDTAADCCDPSNQCINGFCANDVPD
ncbi:MAG: hypothetical protein HOV80_37175 [Polyangiaceae bacterium]|nr:hypothetical protein [Polyangiaceae bacterium]